jgi:beta-lactamase class C
MSLHLGHYPNVMSQKTLDLLHTPIAPAKDVFERNPGNYKRFTGSHYGLGWRILDYKGHKIVFHGGWVKGFINIIVLIPEKDIGIAILQNAETSFPWVAAMTLVDAIFDFPEQNWDTVKPVKQCKKASKTIKKEAHAKKASKPSKPQKKKAKVVKETVVS